VRLIQRGFEIKSKNDVQLVEKVGTKAKKVKN
jgi:hypothetical protein